MPSCDLRPFQQNGSWGYTNKDGQIVIKPQFSRAGRFSEGVALVWTGGVPLTEPIVKSFVKMGYVDEKGRCPGWSIDRHGYFLPFAIRLRAVFLCFEPRLALSLRPLSSSSSECSFHQRLAAFSIWYLDLQKYESFHSRLLFALICHLRSYGVSSNTVPSSLAPPANVVP